MISYIYDWFRRYFSDPQAISLAMVLLFGFAIVMFMGDILAPLFAAIIIAYLLLWVVNALVHLKLPRIGAVFVTFGLFLGVITAMIIGVMPLLWQQTTELFSELPGMVVKAKSMLMHLPEQYPDFVSKQQLGAITDKVSTELASFGKSVVSGWLGSIGSVVTWLVYLILVPFLVFFLLKDGKQISQWMMQFLPKRRRLAIKVWEEMDEQIGNYIRGKLIEIVVVTIGTLVVFLWLDIKYAALLSVLVGISVLIPYVGAAVVTIPVALVAYFQWGWTEQFGWLMLAYAIVQAIDGNIVVPLLFSEAVNLHPIAIIIAVLVFGGFWGVWGVFFAIPLATLIKAVINSWPSYAATE